MGRQVPKHIISPMHVMGKLRHFAEVLLFIFNMVVWPLRVIGYWNDRTPPSLWIIFDATMDAMLLMCVLLDFQIAYVDDNSMNLVVSAPKIRKHTFEQLRKYF